MAFAGEEEPGGHESVVSINTRNSLTFRVSLWSARVLVIGSPLVLAVGVSLLIADYPLAAGYTIGGAVVLAFYSTIALFISTRIVTWRFAGDLGTGSPARAGESVSPADRALLRRELWQSVFHHQPARANPVVDGSASIEDASRDLTIESVRGSDEYRVLVARVRRILFVTVPLAFAAPFITAANPDFVTILDGLASILVWNGLICALGLASAVAPHSRIHAQPGEGMDSGWHHMIGTFLADLFHPRSHAA